MNFFTLHISKLTKINFSKDLATPLIFMVSWFFLWSSIGVESNSIFYFGKNITQNINFIRLNVPLFLSIISSIYLICIFLLKREKLNLSFIALFYIYFLFQLIGLSFNSEVDFTIGNNYLVILGSGTLNLFLFLNFYKYENFSKVLLYLSIFFCFCFVSFILLINFDKLLEYLAYSTFYSLSLPDDRLLDNAYPRSTGLSRIFAVVNIFFICFYLTFNFKKNKIYKYVLFILILLFGTIIWGFQSRGTIISLFSSILAIIFLFKNTNGLKILNFFLILILPIIIFNLSSAISKKIYLKKFDIDTYAELSQSDIENLPEEKKQEVIEYLTKIKEVKKKQIYSNRFLNEEIKSSGRIEIWKYALSNYKKEKIFGYGVQADRYILGKKYVTYGNNSSNVLMYFFLTGGYFSAIILLIILFRISFFSLKIYFEKKNEKIKNSLIFKLSFLLSLFFGVRGLVENSYGLFSIDFLFVITSFFIIENLYKRTIHHNPIKNI